MMDQQVVASVLNVNQIIMHKETHVLKERTLIYQIAPLMI